MAALRASSISFFDVMASIFLTCRICFVPVLSDMSLQSNLPFSLSFSSAALSVLCACIRISPLVVSEILSTAGKSLCAVITPFIVLSTLCLAFL